MHSWIQNHIIQQLTQHSTRRHSELRPRDVEGNLFSYHLKGLLQEGLVEKREEGYSLTIKGMQFAGTFSLKTGKTRLQPKILTAVICQNEHGEHLMARWHRQPNIGLVSFVHGMMHYGESVFVMAAREMAEKAGLSADLAHIGEVYVKGVRGEEVDRHMLVHLFRATNPRELENAPLRPEVSGPFWASLESLSPEQFVPGFYEIAQLVQGSNKPIFEEITVELE
jgi:ADP-ribose pyrophosphatase YjhB (NUDIX family)